jgi:cytidylate kinase
LTESDKPLVIAIDGPAASGKSTLAELIAAELGFFFFDTGVMYRAATLAALRALATEGIQRGHMGLHARQVAAAAGATGAQIERLARQLVAEKRVRIDRAEEILRSWQSGKIPDQENDL